MKNPKPLWILFLNGSLYGAYPTRAKALSGTDPTWAWTVAKYIPAPKTKKRKKR